MKERKVGQGWKYHNSLLLFGFGAVALSVRVVVLDSPKKKKKKRCPTLLWLHSGVLFVSFRPFIIIIFFFFWLLDLWLWGSVQTPSDCWFLLSDSVVMWRSGSSAAVAGRAVAVRHDMKSTEGCLS